MMRPSELDDMLDGWQPMFLPKIPQSEVDNFMRSFDPEARIPLDLRVLLMDMMLSVSYLRRQYYPFEECEV